MAEEDKTSGIRKLAQEKLEQFLTPEQMDALFEGALAITKSANVMVTCKHCKKNQMTYVQVPDAKAVIGALSEVVTKIADVPKEQVQEQDRIIFERIIYMEDPGESKDGD